MSAGHPLNTTATKPAYDEMPSFYCDLQVTIFSLKRERQISNMAISRVLLPYNGMMQYSYASNIRLSQMIHCNIFKVHDGTTQRATFKSFLRNTYYKAKGWIILFLHLMLQTEDGGCDPAACTAGLSPVELFSASVPVVAEPLFPGFVVFSSTWPCEASALSVWGSSYVHCIDDSASKTISSTRILEAALEPDGCEAVVCCLSGTNSNGFGCGMSIRWLFSS